MNGAGLLLLFGWPLLIVARHAAAAGAAELHATRTAEDQS